MRTNAENGNAPFSFTTELNGNILRCTIGSSEENQEYTCYLLYRKDGVKTVFYKGTGYSPEKKREYDLSELLPTDARPAWVSLKVFVKTPTERREISGQEFYYSPLADSLEMTADYHPIAQINETRPKISVIIPVYNTAKYLRECLDSVTRSSLREIEIICVDDGSADESLSILMEYRNQDKRILIFSFPENRGVSMARNAALDNATGEYVCCVDSDDWIEADEFEKTYACAKKYDLDMLFFGAVPFYDSPDLEETYAAYKPYYKMKVDLSSPRTGRQMFLDMLENHDYRPAPWMQLLKREYLNRYHFRFYPGVFYEDILFTFQCLLKAGLCARINETYYHRRIREGSIVTQRKEYLHIYSYATICWEMMNTLAQEKLERDKEKALLAPVKSVVNEMRKAYNAMGESERKQFLEQYLTPLDALRFQMIRKI